MNSHFYNKYRGSRDLEAGDPVSRAVTPSNTKRYLLTLFLFLLGLGTTFAQEVAVAGKVVDATGGGIPGVSITIKGTTRGTNTDIDGNFQLNAPGDGTLVFSFIGFEPKEVPIGNQSTITVTLAEDVKALEEVVVVGYGTARRKDLTGSVTQVTARDFNAGINPNPLQAIQGKVAGLVITQPSGDPTQNPTVRLRGYTSLAGGSDPLYVVDGVIGVPINTIAPSDIESMDVLKDASAAAIYGSRAANGVIIVTTRRGKSGRTSVTFNNYVGLETISNRLDLLDGPGYIAQVSRIKGDASLSDTQRFPRDAQGNGYNTDWVDEITRTGVTNNHNFGISGGSPTFSYFGSVDYINRQGIVKNTGFDRLTGRINLDQKALDNRLSVQYNLSFTNSERKYTDGGIIARAITFLPTLPVRNPSTGDYYEIPGSFDLFNPVAMLENQTNNGVNRVFIGGVNLKYEVIDGLTLGANGAFRNENTVNNRYQDGRVKAYQVTNGRAGRNLFQTNDKLLELTANYLKGFGNQNSNIAILGGYSYQNVMNDGFGAYNTQFITNSFGYDNLGQGAGSLLTPRSDYTTSYRNAITLASFFGRATLNLNERYNLTATLRYDGSSKFGANNKWALFPSIAGGWTISEESFFPKTDVLNYLKLRVGWGQTGNSEGIAPYQSIQLYGQRGTYYDGSIGDFLPGYGITQNANPNLKWEVLSQANIGLDFQLINGRFSGTVEYYDKTTRDMLYPYSVPADGVRYFTNSIIANVGRMRNNGVELSFGGGIVVTDNFSWESRIVGAYNKNEIVSLKNDEFDAGRIRFNPFGGRGLSDVFASILEAGRPLGVFNNVPQFVEFVQVTDQDGNINSVPGFVAMQGDVPVTNVGDARVGFNGNPQPFLTGSWINSFRYRNLDVNFQVRGVFGNKILNNLRSNLMLPGSILETNMLADINELPVNYSTNVLSDYWLESGTFMRLDNWQVGYNVPINNKHISNARFYLGGNNLFIITKYKGIDPELEVKGDLQDGGRSQTPNSLGMDAGGIYPKTRSIQLGVNLTF
ncbi:TonB-dependent receptor [Rhabdobacter roseus]|uniref:Iron complex outermembrane receptor protein n=1 Tax=Rhabdobacter roseus TaxID=1655419 RepID=A0A840TR85_9BACT|nr:TonB-dependent receptor [Rhabdobacter roseus]MBB5285435.1 iron complex outermembrane receptor protein [Rhabdobacter roseus]